MGARTRAAWAPLRVAAARARARPGRGALVAIGVGVAAAALAGVVGGATIAADRSLRAGLEQLPVAQRSFTATWLGTPPAGGYAEIDRAATSALHRLGPQAPARTIAFPELNLGGQLVELGAVDDPGRWLRLASGRLPRTCVPARCEVLEAHGTPVTSVSEPGLRLVVVGHTAGPLPVALSPLTRSSHQAKGGPPPVLLAGGVSQLSALPVFSALYRSYGWTTPIAPDSLHDWQISALLDRGAAAERSLRRLGTPFGLTGPTNTLTALRESDAIAARRMQLVGGGAAALLLGFVLLAAAGLRREAGIEWARLERHGARLGQLWTFASVEAGWITLAGAVIGALVGAAGVAIAADRAGVGAWAVLDHTILSVPGITVLLIAWLAGAVVLLAGERAAGADLRLGPVRGLDLAALAVAGAVALAAARGSASSTSLAGGSDPLLALLPGLVAVAGAIVTARLVGPLLRLAGRGLRRGPASVRLALVSLGREGGRPTLAAAFLVAGIGLGIFAVAYRTTLSQGERDQAAFQVPLDFTLSEGPALRLPLAVAGVRRYSQLAPGALAAPVFRAAGTAPAPGLPAQATVLGVPAAALARIHNWRGEFASVPQDRLAAALRPAQPPALRGAALPPSAQAISLPVTTHGRPVSLVLAVEAPSGQFDHIPLGDTTRGETTLHARLPAADRGGRVVGLVVTLRFADAQALAHQGIEGGLTIVARGSLALGPLRAAGPGSTSEVTDWSAWVTRGTARPEAAGAATAGLRYALDGSTNGLLRPRQPTDGQPVPVIASPGIAALAGGDHVLQMTLLGVESLTVRIVGVAHRFPTAGGSFVVGDEADITTALNSNDPGIGTPLELWLGVPPTAQARVAAELSRRPFSALQVASRGAIQSRLAAQPLARGLLDVLAMSAVLALVLGVAGLVLVCAADLGDERDHLVDLEAMGVGPVALRRHLVLRALVLVAVGAVGGLVLGAVLERLVIDLVSLGAGTATASPPLRGVQDWALVGAGLLAFAVCGLGLVWAFARTAFRAPVPGRIGAG
ncbi:MAG TPA: FtsX-like permease family protein [Gaiellales bacterium]